MTIKTVGIIGAGQMGNGIAHVVAQSGYDVLLHDLTEERVQAALATINGNMARQVSRGKLTEEERAAALGRIRYIPSHEGLGEADLVIEAATEDEDVKRAIFTSVCPNLNETCILASNTSSISITRLAAATDRPERFIGMHFMNPVPVMSLVELIRGIATDEPTVKAMRALTEKLGKTAVSAED